MKRSFANEFKNNYSSAISREINSKKEIKEFETKGEKFTFRNTVENKDNGIYTNENMVSNNQTLYVYTFRSVNDEDEEIFRSENIVDLEDSIIIDNKDNQNEKILFKFDKNESDIEDRNTNYQSVI